MAAMANILMMSERRVTGTTRNLRDADVSKYRGYPMP
jgi:hypothetical protein